MKATATVILFMFISVIFAGCVKENLDDCPDDEEYNLILDFEYFDHKGVDIFSSRLETIDLFFYDQTQKQFMVASFDDVIGSTDRKRRILIDPGTYYIVSWANKITQREIFTYPSVNINLGYNYLYHTRDESTDPLHYAPDLRHIDRENLSDIHDLYRVEVKEGEVTTHMVSYMSAHRTLNIYLKGFYEFEHPEVDRPEIFVTNLTQFYDDYLGKGNRNMSLTKKAAEITVTTKNDDDGTPKEEIRGYGQFYVPHFDNESAVTIDVSGVRTTGDPYVYTIPMNDILKELELVVFDGDDAVIDIEIELINETWVSISLPSWLVKDVEGGFNEDDE